MEIPNEYGTFLADLLKPIDIANFDWQIGRTMESYKVIDDQLSFEELFPEDQDVIDGSVLKSVLENHTYYVIFADIKAYPKGSNISEIETYEEFIKSECQLVLLIADSSYTDIYCKDKKMLELLYKNAKDCGFENVEYITDENDSRTRLSL